MIFPYGDGKVNAIARRFQIIFYPDAKAEKGVF